MCDGEGARVLNALGSFMRNAVIDIVMIWLCDFVCCQ